MGTHTPYRHSRYISSPYIHHLYTLPNDANMFLPPNQHTGTLTPTPFGTRWMVDIYLVMKSEYLPLLPDNDLMHTTLM
jgi:hypothetical protein